MNNYTPIIISKFKPAGLILHPIVTLSIIAFTAYAIRMQLTQVYQSCELWATTLSFAAISIFFFVRYLLQLHRIKISKGQIDIKPLFGVTRTVFIYDVVSWKEV